MKIGRLSPSKVKRIRLCEARAVAMASPDQEYADEVKMEATLAGTLAHAAAKHWYRPNPEWVKAINAIADPVARGQAAWQQMCAGTPKHPITDPDVAFKNAIVEVAGDQELPREAASVLDARSCFEQILNYYPREKMNVLFAERQYKGTLNQGPAAGLPMNLIIDLGVDRGGGRLGLIDFKTGYIQIDEADMWSDDQVLMNLIAVHYDPMLTSYRSKDFQFFWVRGPYASELVAPTAEQLSDYECWLAMEFQRLRDLDPDKARETPNRFCSSCSRRLTKCVAYRSHIAEAFGQVQGLTPEELAKLTVGDVMARIEMLGQHLKIIDKAESTLKQHLIGEMEQHQLAVLETQTGEGENLQHYRAKIRRNKIRSFETQAVIDQANRCQIGLSAVLSPRPKNQVLEAFQGQTQALAALNSSMRETTTNPWLEVNAIKPPKPPKPAKKGKK